jgi:hypothetical protein
VIWMKSEGDTMRYGLNIEPCWRTPMWGSVPTWRRGVALVLHWRGWRNYYAIRLRLRHPKMGPPVLRLIRVCIACRPASDYWCSRHPRGVRV